MGVRAEMVEAKSKGNKGRGPEELARGEEAKGGKGMRRRSYWGSR